MYRMHCSLFAVHRAVLRDEKAFMVKGVWLKISELFVLFLFFFFCCFKWQTNKLIERVKRTQIQTHENRFTVQVCLWLRIKKTNQEIKCYFIAFFFTIGIKSVHLWVAHSLLLGNFGNQNNPYSIHGLNIKHDQKIHCFYLHHILISHSFCSIQH